MLLDAPSLIWVLIVGVVLAAYGLVSVMPYLTDAQGHHLISRFAWKHPHLFLDVWNRPLYTVLTALPAAVGFRVNQLVHIGMSIVVIWFTVHLAREMGVSRPGLIAPLMLVQPAFLSVSWTTMTEQLFLIVFLGACILFVEDRPKAAGVVIGLAPLVRPEGLLLVPLWSAILSRRGYTIASLPWLGLLAWILAGTLVYGDPDWLISANPYQIGLGLRTIEWDYLFKFYDDFCGPVVFILAQVGAWYWAYRKPRALIQGLLPGLLSVIVVFLFYVLVFDNVILVPPGHIGWRLLISLSPWIAILSLEGVNCCLDGKIPARVNLSAFLLLQVGIVSLVALVYAFNANAYAPMLCLLAGGVAATVFIVLRSVNGPWSRGYMAVLGLIIAAVAFVLLKVPPTVRTPAEKLVEESARWFLALPAPRPRIATAMWGFYPLTGTDPWDQDHTVPITEVPHLRSGDLLIWDNWAAGRWRGISKPSLVARDDFDVVAFWRTPEATNEIVVFRRR